MRQERVKKGQARSLSEIPWLEDVCLVGLDWGTTSLRAYLLGRDGEFLGENTAPSGVMHLERFDPAGQTNVPREKLFEAALDEVCGAWPAEVVSRLPIIACGMVGSTAGWKEAAYLKTPAGPHELAEALTTVERTKGRSVQIVPGVCSYGAAGATLPEIMRGEETQVAGILSTLGDERSAATANLLVGLPGTHSKWVQVRDGRIVSFTTFITGELYGLLTKHSVIAKTPKQSLRFEEAAFQAGLQLGRAQNPESAGGLLSTIFSTRSRRILGELKEEDQPDYLSGLLLGEELQGVGRVLAREKKKPGDFTDVLLAGERTLCARYELACRALQWPRVNIAENATVKGLWSIARQAGLAA